MQIPLITSQKLHQRPENKLQINFLNMGQGDSIFITTPLGRTILVDCGTRRQEYNLVTMYGEPVFVDPHLRIDPIRNKLDLLIITHPDEDHCNRIEALLKLSSLPGPETGRPVEWPSPRIGKVLLSTNKTDLFRTDLRTLVFEHGTREIYDEVFETELDNDNFTYTNHEPSGLMEVITLNEESEVKEPILLLRETQEGRPDFTIKILASGVIPQSRKRKLNQVALPKDVDRNALSMVLLLEYGTDRILLTGDANEPVENFLLRYMREYVKDLSLVQIPHHGSDSDAMLDGFINTAKAKCAVCSAAYQEHGYGLPRAQTLLKYAQYAESLPQEPSPTPDAMETDDPPIDATKPKYYFRDLFCFILESSLTEESDEEDEMSQPVVKKRRTDSGPEKSVIKPQENKFKFERLDVDGYTLYGPGSKNPTVWGVLAVKNNIEVTGSRDRQNGLESEHPETYGSSIELEFDGIAV